MTPEELSTISEAEREKRSQETHSINVCMAAGCMSLHAEQLKDALDKEVKSRGLGSQCCVRGVGCMGLCAAGPLVSVEPGGVMHKTVTPGDAKAMVDTLEKVPD